MVPVSAGSYTLCSLGITPYLFDYLGRTIGNGTGIMRVSSQCLQHGAKKALGIRISTYSMKSRPKLHFHSEELVQFFHSCITSQSCKFENRVWTASRKDGFTYLTSGNQWLGQVHINRFFSSQNLCNINLVCLETCWHLPLSKDTCLTQKNYGWKLGELELHELGAMTWKR